MEKVKELALSYYARKDIQKAIYLFAQDRETIPRYGEGFGKRPDFLQYESDLFEHARKGATSFHVSEELWFDPLQIKTGMSLEEANNLRKGWDLLIDIDSKYLDYSNITARLLLRALEFHSIKNYGIKFSGSKGFHIIVPWQAFPEAFQNIPTKNMFPDWARVISLYLTEMIRSDLIEKISETVSEKSYIKDFDAPKKVMPDIVLVSPRHLFRAPYSLHEKTALASIVLEKKELENFNPQLADPLRIKIRNFTPEARKDEAKELLMQALDWWSEQEKSKKPLSSQKINLEGKKFEDIDIKYITEDTFPPVIQNILKGMKEDGRKRAVFILITFFRSLNFPKEYIEKTLEEWNKKNYKPLKEGYIKTQLEWFKKQKKMLPPNFDSDYYKAIGVYETDSLSEKTKNPVPYTLAKARMKMQGKK